MPPSCVYEYFYVYSSCVTRLRIIYAKKRQGKVAEAPQSTSSAANRCKSIEPSLTDQIFPLRTNKRHPFLIKMSPYQTLLNPTTSSLIWEFFVVRAAALLVLEKAENLWKGLKGL